MPGRVKKKVSTPNRKTRRAVRSVTRKSKTNKVSLDNWNLSYTIDRSKSKYKNSKLKLKERIAIPIYSCDAESFNDEQIREDLLNLFTQEELNDAFNCPDDIDYSTHPIVVKKYYDKSKKQWRYRIFDGHHRLTAYLHNNYSEIVVDVIEEEDGCNANHVAALKHKLNNHNAATGNGYADWLKTIKLSLQREWSGSFENINRTDIEKTYDSFMRDFIIPIGVKPPAPSVRDKIIVQLLSYFAQFSEDINEKNGCYTHYHDKQHSWKKAQSTAYLLSKLHTKFPDAHAPYGGTKQTTHHECEIFNQGHLIFDTKSVTDAFFNGTAAFTKNFHRYNNTYPCLLTALITKSGLTKAEVKQEGLRIIKLVEDRIDYLFSQMQAQWHGNASESQLKQWKRDLKKCFRFGWRTPHFSGEKGLIDIVTGKPFVFPKSWIKTRKVWLQNEEIDNEE